MNHINKEMALEAWLDGELEDEEQAEVFAHLACCASCRSYARLILAVRRGATEEGVSFPPSIDEAVLGKAGEEHTKRAEPKWFRSFRVPVPVAAAAILIATVISILVGQHLGAKYEATRWERETGMFYQMPAVVVVGQVEKNQAEKSNIR